MVNAYARAKKAFALIFVDRCTVFIKKKRRDPRSGETKFADKAIILDEPCRLSFVSFPATEFVFNASGLAQGVKLFISPDITIPPGSKIVVAKDGTEGVYSNSGEPARYETHQEIALEKFKGWA